MMRFQLPFCLAATLALLIPAWARAQDVAPAHGVAMHGDLKYGPEFEHFDYVSPNAPKGGEISEWAQGNFDSFNMYTIQGNATPWGAFPFESQTISRDSVSFLTRSSGLPS